MSEARFDYVVVGAGTAGCLLANRLSADASKRVLLIEAGGRDNYHWIHIPVGYLYCIDNPRTDWRYRTEPDAGLNGRSLLYPRGKTLGGCSSINGMIYIRGQARDYDAWASATGEDAWRWHNVLPDFMAHESHYSLDDERQICVGQGSKYSGNPTIAKNGNLAPSFHGRSGEWRIEKQRLRWDILDAFADAAVEAGIPRTEDFNRGDNEGVAYFEVNQKAGWRWNASKAFLRPIQSRPNLTVMTSTQVRRLRFARSTERGLHCVGAELIGASGAFSVRAERELILCAGAIGTPQLLQLSGIAPRGLLARHGIEPVHELPGVGANLQDHLQIRAVFKVSGAKTLNTLANSWWGKAAIAWEYVVSRTGPMSMAPSQLGIFTKSRPELAHTNLEFHVQPLSLPAFGQPLHAFPAFTASVCNLNPTSRGSVNIVNGDFKTPPAIAPNYLSTDADRQVAADSLRVARRIAAQPALAKYSPQEFKPGIEFQSDDELARLAGDIATTIFHPVGTAKMGRSDDATAVVDGKLRVHGVRGLRVVDASVMPTITSGNTNSPTLMIAEKAARWIIEESRASSER
ncbi:MAG: choline dehydrogenase [Burkholderiales bacterium]|nr:MAG: choline dehydrogenase [Burkholderiales bacterium]